MLMTAEKLLTDEDRWQAVVDRRRSDDGKFVYAVQTTGVYCRPSCAARRARREHVEFHRTPADAEKAGFRACKRCRPREPSIDRAHADAVARACKQILESDEALDLAALSTSAGMSASHFHRIFKSLTGLTPKAYATAHRMDNPGQDAYSESNVSSSSIPATRRVGIMRKFAAAGLTVLLALSSSALVFAQGAPRNITVLANYTFHGRHSPFFVALDKGFFEQAGFKVDIQPATGSGFVISAIESGKADYGLADASTTVQAIAKGSKVKGFQVYMDISTNGLAALTPLPTPESALGKTIASQA